MKNLAFLPLAAALLLAGCATALPELPAQPAPPVQFKEGARQETVRGVLLLGNPLLMWGGLVAIVGLLFAVYLGGYIANTSLAPSFTFSRNTLIVIMAAYGFIASTSAVHIPSLTALIAKRSKPRVISIASHRNPARRTWRSRCRSRM